MLRRTILIIKDCIYEIDCKCCYDRNRKETGRNVNGFLQIRWL